MEDNAERLQFGEALVERLLRLVPIVGKRGAINLPEVAGVGEAGAHDARVAGGDRLAAVAGDEVRDDHEAVGEIAGRVPEDEAFLIGADGRADDFGGNVEEARLELAHQHDRPFDEPRDLLEQALVLDELEPLGEGEAAGVGRNDRLAAVGVEHDPGLQERIGIVLIAADCDRLGRHEAMARGGIAGGETVDREGHDFRDIVRDGQGAQDAA